MYRVGAWLFLGTAVVGTWVAYDQFVAMERLALLAAGLAIAYLIVWLGRIDAERTLVVGGIVCAIVAAILGTMALLPDNVGLPVRDDAIAAALIVLLPLSASSVVRYRQRHQWLMASVVGLLTLWTLLMLLWTQERSAWLALIVGLLGSLVVWRRFAQVRRRKPTWLLDFFCVALVAIGLGAYVLVITMPDLQAWLPFNDRLTVTKHLQLWRNALVLFQDYVFTGSGLGVTGMVFSTYVLLHHVPEYSHVHNLFLQVAIEQGLLGVLALLSMSAATGFALATSWHIGNRADDGLRVMSMAALAAMLCHGLLDAELYASWLAPLLFLPFGFTLVAARLDQYIIDDRRMIQRTKSRRGFGYLFGLSTVVLAVVLAFLPAVRSTFFSNLGSVAQTKAELSVYSWPDWPIQDAVRRSPAVSLEPTLADFDIALRLNSANITALRRLGQISLSRGDYVSAQHYLEEAYARAPQQATIKLLLGETLAITGQFEQGALVWRSTLIHADWLEYRRWWYVQLNATREAAWLADAFELANHQTAVTE